MRVCRERGVPVVLKSWGVCDCNCDEESKRERERQKGKVSEAARLNE